MFDRIVHVVTDNWDVLLIGAQITLELALISFAFAMVIGLVAGVAATSANRLVRAVVRVYVDIIRGVPLLVLTFFIFFGIPQLIQQPLNEFWAGVLSITLNAGAYISEIVRGGIQAVPTGQKEASLSIGMTKLQSMIYIVLPYAVRIMIPSIINQFVTSLKDTTIVSVIGIVELLQVGKKIAGRTFQSFEVYTVIAVIYLVIITALTILAKHLEKRQQVKV
jgi:polar amino acid transport system substrate-binding protein